MPQQPEMAPQAPMAAPAPMMMPQQPQGPVQLNAQGLEKLAQDFDLKNMDVAPGADPRSVTDMQRMMRAQYLAQFKGQPGIDNRWIQEQELQAANIGDWPKAFLEGPSPLDEHQAEMAKQELRGIGLDNDLKEQQIKKTAKEAEKTYHEAGKVAFERGVAEGMAGGVPGMEDAPDDGGVFPLADDPAAGVAEGMDPSGMGVGSGPTG
jgi:hypothetical protein